MNLLWKKIVFAALLVWIFFHYFFIIVNHSPIPATGKIKSASVLYTFPFFCQNWSLFVPAPSHHKLFYVRYKTGGGWSPWQNTGNELVARYKASPAKGSDMLLLLLTNSLHYVCAAFPEQSAVFHSESTGSEFRVFKYMTDKILQKEYKLGQQTEYELLIVDQGPATRAFYCKSLIVK